MKGLKPVSYKEKLGELELFTLEKRRVRVDLINKYKSLKGGCKEDSPTMFLMKAQWQNKKQWAQSWTEGSLCIREHFLTVKETEQQQKCSRRLWNLLLGNLQKLPECSPGYPAQGILGWAGVELDGLQSSLSTSTNLWFCDFSEMQDRLFNTLNTNPMDLISAWCKYIYHAKLF